MFALSFLYPRPVKRRFDYEYHRKVHLPLGVGWTARQLQLQPRMAWICRIGEHEPDCQERYAAIAHVLFDTHQERDRFATLFDHQDIARRLSTDWYCFTEAPPEVQLSEWTLDDDMGPLIRHFEEHLSDLHA